MAGNVSTKDGLGFEEVNQASYTDMISGVQIYASSGVTAALGTIVTVSSTTISGTNIRGGNIITPGSVTDTDGLLTSVSVGSPASFGGRVAAGVVTTAGGSGGTIKFGQQMPSTTYSVAFGVSGADMTETPTVSGAKNVSGCEVIGAASTTYYYVAAGG